MKVSNELTEQELAELERMENFYDENIDDWLDYQDELSARSSTMPQ